MLYFWGQEKMRTLKKTSFSNETALVRVDFNVPIDNGEITDNSRIVGAANTIKYILNEGGSCVLMSHFFKKHRE